MSALESWILDKEDEVEPKKPRAEIERNVLNHERSQ